MVACGGGVVLREENRRLLRELGSVVYLQVAAAEAIRRCGATQDRPLLAGRSESEVAGLLASREPLYVQVADFTVATQDLSPHEVAERIERWLAETASLTGQSEENE